MNQDNIEYIKKEFVKRGIVRGGILFLGPVSSIEFICKAKELGIRILGIDGFYLSEEETRPSMENSINLSEQKNMEECYHVAEEFVKQRLSDGLMFEISV